jgi:hypothetical protein
VIQRFPSHQVEKAKHVLERAGNEEVLLHEAQFFTGRGFIIWIENFGDGLRCYLFFDGAIVVSDIKGFEVKGFDGLCFPEAKDWRYSPGIPPRVYHRQCLDACSGIQRTPYRP